MIWAGTSQQELLQLQVLRDVCRPARCDGLLAFLTIPVTWRWTVGAAHRMLACPTSPTAHHPSGWGLLTHQARTLFECSQRINLLNGWLMVCGT